MAKPETAIKYNSFTPVLVQWHILLSYSMYRKMGLKIVEWKGWSSHHHTNGGLLIWLLPCTKDMSAPSRTCYFHHIPQKCGNEKQHTILSAIKRTNLWPITLSNPGRSWGWGWLKSQSSRAESSTILSMSLAITKECTGWLPTHFQMYFLAQE
jgi:hypothetical protein